VIGLELAVVLPGVFISVVEGLVRRS